MNWDGSILINPGPRNTHRCTMPSRHLGLVHNQIVCLRVDSECHIYSHLGREESLLVLYDACIVHHFPASMVDHLARVYIHTTTIAVKGAFPLRVFCIIYSGNCPSPAPKGEKHVHPPNLITTTTGSPLMLRHRDEYKNGINEKWSASKVTNNVREIKRGRGAGKGRELL